MIFVTVGTHEQQFNRLVKAIDDLVASGKIAEEVFIQTGYSDYVPSHCAWSDFLPCGKMRELMKDADVVVTHGGPSSIVEAMASGHAPVVVPRRGDFDEHVNDHQVNFTKILDERQGGVIPVYDIDSLLGAIESSRLGVEQHSFNSNNANFCSELEKLIRGL